jgi:hypothetical protein
VLALDAVFCDDVSHFLLSAARAKGRIIAECVGESLQGRTGFRYSAGRRREKVLSAHHKFVAATDAAAQDIRP